MERQRMSDADRERYLSMVKMKITDPKVIALIEEDIEHGLSAKEIDDYTDRHLKYEQQKAISEMYRKDFPRAVIGAIGRSDMDAEKMRVAMELYENNVSINEIKKGEKVLIIIGPEGGFSQREFDMFKEKHIPIVSIGDLILKADTAVTVALGDIIYEYKG